MRFNRNRIIEFTIAGVVVAVLFIVMLPRFQKAQHTAGVAKALSDLQKISQAMEEYNKLNSSDPAFIELHHVNILDRGESSEPDVLTASADGAQDVHSILGYQQRTKTGVYQNRVAFQSLLTFDYRPPESMLIINGYVFKNEYVVETGLWRSLTIHRGRARGFKPKLDTLPFDRKGDLPFIGVTRGPYFDTHLGRVKPAAETAFWGGEYHNRYIPRFDNDKHHVEYNPTNGVRSHGYIVYRSPAGPVKSATDYLNELMGKRKLRRPNIIVD